MGIRQALVDWEVVSNQERDTGASG